MAIPTKYDGIEYRSRLEARWAAFMRNIGWDITYEPFDGDGYIPDFLVQGKEPFLVEVKPAVTQGEYEAPIEKAESGLRRHWQHDILIVGASPLPSLIEDPWFGMQPDVGILGEYQPLFTDDNGGAYYSRDEWDELRAGYANRKYDERAEWAWGPAVWNSCGQCYKIGVRHVEQGWHGRPCGHGDGDKYVAGARKGFIESLWADACNDVKWRGRAA